MSHDTEPMDADALNRRAAELMGWTGLQTWWGKRTGMNPHGVSAILPQPATDYGDALRLMLFTLRECDAATCLCFSNDNLKCEMWQDVPEKLTNEKLDRPLRAITRACVAALEAAATTGKTGKEQGE